MHVLSFNFTYRLYHKSAGFARLYRRFHSICGFSFPQQAGENYALAFLGFSPLVAKGLKGSAAALPYSRAVHSSHPLDFVIVNNDLSRAAASLTWSEYALARCTVFDRE